MRKELHIDDKVIPVEISADTPRQYREAFGKDLLVGMMSMKDQLDTEILENLAFTMAKAADPELADVSIHEWLSRFSVMGLYNAAAEILDAWTGNMETASKGKKK